MPETQQPTPQADRPSAGADIQNQGTDPVRPVKGSGGGGPGGSEAGVAAIFGLALYLVLLTLIVIYTLVKIWPVPTPSRDAPPTASATATPTPTPTSSPTQTPVGVQTPSPTLRTGPASTQVSPSPTPTPSPTATPTPSPSPLQPSPVRILWWQFDLWDEQRLLLLVILGGALGTLVHSLRSVYWYVGNRDLVKSWMPMYFMLPFAGAALALVFYLVIRGGFFSPQSSFQQTSPFGFAAFSALIGMFSSQAVLKLKDVAEVLLSKPPKGEDAKPQETVNPPVVNPPVVNPSQPGGNKPTTPPTGGNPPVQQ